MQPTQPIKSAPKTPQAKPRPSRKSQKKLSEIAQFLKKITIFECFMGKSQ